MKSETSEIGLAAVGDIPAVTGKVSELYALKYVDTLIGTGELAQPHKWYTVNYTGWTLDGKKFDSSLNPGREPFVFPYGAHRVITGWDTGFEGMRVGGKRRLIVPYQLAYGVFGHPPDIPERATLIFDVEFLGQSDTPPHPPAPSQTKPEPAPQSESTQKPEASKPATDSSQK
ncbi:MAG: FKBP-type peptidyl-prolyl cis-trans isomerase [Acidobacteria bacterium]|nr:FKBP-type peptidyl-prolyl cis-trans isomerase [Acidobacteriota bacterium]